MPYPNISDPALTEKMDSCVKDVQAKGHDKESAIKICYSSIMEKASAEQLAETFKLKDGVLEYFKTEKMFTGVNNQYDELRGFFNAQFPNDNTKGTSCYLMDADFAAQQAIVDENGKRYAVNYTMQNGKPQFDNRSEWQEVKQDWRPITTFSEKIAFNVEQFQARHFAKPFRILPVGKFYRGERVLDITAKDTAEVYQNWQAGLPRYGLAVNVEHGTDANQPGNVGLIKKISLQSDGIYADQVDFSEAGKKLLDEDRYRAVSPEIIWTKNSGARYQDPKTGKYHDNVLTGLALTTSPFFGEDVAVFSDKFNSPTMHQVHTDGPIGGDTMNPEVKKLMEEKKCTEEEAMKILEGEKEKASIKGGEKVDIKPEEFADLQAKAAQVEMLSAKLKENETQHAKLVEAFSAERQIRRTIEFTEAAEKFSAIPMKTDELGKNLLWMYDADNTDKKEHYSYFETLLTATNEAVSKGQLFSTLGSGGTKTNENADPFLTKVEQVRAEKFSDKPYAEGFTAAFDQVGKSDPALAVAYANKQHRD